MLTARLSLRRWTESDREPFAVMNADPRVMEFMPSCLSREESDAVVNRIESHFDRHAFGLYAAELLQERRFIGFIGLSVPAFEAPFMPCVEVGWRLGATDWGQGFAPRAPGRF